MQINMRETAKTILLFAKMGSCVGGRRIAAIAAPDEGENLSL
jgi:hypothetical protein